MQTAWDGAGFELTTLHILCTFSTLFHLSISWPVQLLLTLLIVIIRTCCITVSAQCLEMDGISSSDSDQGRWPLVDTFFHSNVSTKTRLLFFTTASCSSPGSETSEHPAVETRPVGPHPSPHLWLWPLQEDPGRPLQLLAAIWNPWNGGLDRPGSSARLSWQQDGAVLTVASFSLQISTVDKKICAFYPFVLCRLQLWTCSPQAVFSTL